MHPLVDVGLRLWIVRVEDRTTGHFRVIVSSLISGSSWIFDRMVVSAGSHRDRRARGTA